jgi:RNA polymerase sigma-70 factor, ECF subfamily
MSTLAVNAPSISKSAPTPWTGYVARMALGDQTALAELYDQSCGLAYSLALRMMGTQEAAEEVVMEAYQSLWASAKSFDPSRGSVEAWVVVAVRKQALAKQRLCKSRSPAVFRALAGIEGTQRAVLEMVYFEGRSVNEIAQLLQQPTEFVTSSIGKALAALRGVLPVAQ